MIAATQLMKPKNWQDFEKLCKLLWGEIWDCSDSIKQHGRQGQQQHGVDVYAYVEKYGGYCGIQCKGKDDYTNAQLTIAEIDTEIKKAQSFSPKLKRLIFATTANKDSSIEQYIREKDIESINNSSFHIDICSWEDIVDMMERERTVYNWYLNNCQFREATNLQVTFSNGKNECTVHPIYIRTTKKYRYKEPVKSIFGDDLLYQQANYGLPPITSLRDIINPPCKVNKCWCKLNIRIENIGKTVIKSPKMTVWFKEKDIESISDRFHYHQSFFGCDSNTIATLNAEKSRKREVFQEYRNGVVYKPLDKVFVQQDNRDFSLSFIPQRGMEKLPLGWEFLCEDYSQKGILIVNICPIYEDKEEIIEVKSKAEEREEVLIEPKIVEE